MVTDQENWEPAIWSVIMVMVEMKGQNHDTHCTTEENTGKPWSKFEKVVKLLIVIPV